MRRADPPQPRHPEQPELDDRQILSIILMFPLHGTQVHPAQCSVLSARTTNESETEPHGAGSGMLVVFTGLFKAGKEGISWKGALKALESWQCCLLSVG